jgi:peptide/nickel transport system ATP-binding protein
MAAPVMQAQGLRTWFEVGVRLFRPPLYVKAVDGVDLDLYRDRTTAVVGESGCGKTTLGRTLLRLIEPKDGKLIYDGQEITHLKERDLTWLRRKAQVVPQDPYSSLNPAFTIEKTLAEPLIVHKMGTEEERRKQVERALEDVHLTPPDVFARKYPHMLSGGQRQRVAVARAAILNPEVIVADEPVSMLDASVRVSILNLLGELQSKYHIAFVYVTHDLATARHFSNQINIMYAGKIVESGPTEDLVREPLHPYTKALIDALPDPDPANRLRERSSVPGEPPSLIEVPPGCPFHPRCPIARAGLCDVEVPLLRELRPGHVVACHLAE